MGTHPIFESDFDCLTENIKEIEMADIDIFGDDPVVPEEKKENGEEEVVEKLETEEAKEIENEKEEENKEMEQENGTKEKMVQDGGVIDDEKVVQDGGTIEDEPPVPTKAVVP